MLWFSKIVVGKSQWHSSHHCEVSKKCPKLLPSPGFEPRPFSLSVQAYHAMLDTVSARSRTRYCPKRRVSQGMSTHFRQHRCHTDHKFGSAAASMSHARTMKPSRRPWCLILGLSSSEGLTGRLRLASHICDQPGTTAHVCNVAASKG